MSIEDKIRGASAPDRLWTCGGISSEMLSGVVSPLCWSVWEEAVDLAYRRALADFGVLSAAEVKFANDVNHQPAAPFFGHLAINVDATRELIGRIPGVSANEFERDMLGGVRDGIADEPTVRSRIPAMIARVPGTLRTSSSRVAGLHAANRAWWETEVLAPSRTNDAGTRSALASLAQLRAARERFADSLYAHVRVRFVTQGARRVVVRLVDRAGDESLAAPILGGYGGTGDIAAADDLWRLAQEEIDLDEFLRRHGFRGTHEGNVFTRSWREEPASVTKLAAAYARRPDAVRPGEREATAVRDRLAAERRLVALLPRTSRPIARWLLARAENLMRTIQLGRANYLMALDGARAAARELAAELVADQRLVEPDDVFFLTIEELDTLVRGRLSDAHEITRRRREHHLEHAATELPPTFTGMPAPVAVQTPTAEDGTTRALVTGTSGNSGVVEGRARVILDPSDEADLDDGDILVCGATDPGWMALLALAAGVVIDNGGETSHGAIVARELGIPCVIGTITGTTVIADLDRIRVDGSRGRVEILERATRA